MKSIAFDLTELSFTGRLPTENILLQGNALSFDGVPAR